MYSYQREKLHTPAPVKTTMFFDPLRSSTTSSRVLKWSSFCLGEGSVRMSMIIFHKVVLSRLGGLNEENIIENNKDHSTRDNEGHLTSHLKQSVIKKTCKIAERKPQDQISSSCLLPPAQWYSFSISTIYVDSPHTCIKTTEMPINS